jgi:asparagine synthase (glutamine-hydrolysing)
MKEADHSWPALFASEKEREAASKMQWELYGPFRQSGAYEGPPPSTLRMLNGTTVASLIGLSNPIPFADWTKRYATTRPETVLAESFNGQVFDKIRDKWHPLNTAMYAWTKTMFPNILLRYVGDNVDMVHHVESRTPFLDHHLTEYAMGIPPALKMKFDPQTEKLQEKWILREAVKPFVTEEIYNRRKVPFLGPVEYSADGFLYKEIKRLVTKENVEKLGFLAWDKVDGLAERAFVDHVHDAFRMVLGVSQLIAISRRFGVQTADPVELD